MLEPRGSSSKGEGDVQHPGRGGNSNPILEGFGDASYEEGWAQTGVLVKYRGMIIAWKSTKQPQVPRSTAESECTAMAYASQYLEGIFCLFVDMRIPTGVPVLWCDNRAAAHLTPSPCECRTKALVDRVIGVRSLVELKVPIARAKATIDMQADVLTKFMSGEILPRQREFVGSVPLGKAV